MKKRMISLLLALCFVPALLPAAALPAAAGLACDGSCTLAMPAQDVPVIAKGGGGTAKGVIASGNWGTCPWEIDSNGKLTVYPGTGANTDSSSPWAEYANKITSVVFEKEGDSSVVAPVRCVCLFSDCQSLSSVDFTNCSTGDVQMMDGMFSRCKSLTSVTFGEGWDTGSVKSMNSMFSECTSLASLDLSNWKIEDVNAMKDFLSGCTSLVRLTAPNGKTVQVAASPADEGSAAITGLDQLGLVTVTADPGSGSVFSCWKAGETVVSWDAEYAFAPDSDLSLTAVFPVVIANGIWGTCPWELDAEGKLTVHPGEGANTNQVSPWAAYAGQIRSVVFADDISSFVKAPADCSYLFSGFTSLTSVDIPSHSIPYTYYMRYMFYGCTSLVSLDLSDWITSSLALCPSMFEGCTSLTSLDLSGWKTKKIWDMNSMFKGCTSLASLNLTDWEIEDVNNMSDFFSGCTSLTELTIPSMEYYICLGVSPAEGGSAMITGIDRTNMYILVKAVPKEGYDFLGWYYDDIIYSRNAEESINSKYNPRPFIAEFSASSYKVTVTAGANMTRLTDSGELSQNVSAGSAMTDVVFTANKGYCFPEDYSVEAVNGVSVTRVSDKTIRISGTPTGAAAIALPDAPEEPSPEPAPALQQGPDMLGTDAGMSGAKLVWYGGRRWVVLAYDGKDGDGDPVQYIPEGSASAVDLYPQGTAVLLSPDTSTATAFSAQNNNNSYASSLLKTEAQNAGKNFTDREKAAAAARTLEGFGGNYDDSGDYDGNRVKGSTVNGAVFWPLSAAEAEAVDDGLRVMICQEENKDSWLRSPGINDNCAAALQNDGRVNRTGYNVTSPHVRVHPAFLLDLSAVLFTSAAEDGKTSGPVGENALKAVVVDYRGKEWKLTLKDDGTVAGLDGHKGFTASFVSRNGDVWTIKYSGAQAWTNTNNELISAVIVGSDGTVKYYGNLAKASSEEDDSTCTVNVSGMLGSGDTLYVFNELANGDGKTDYASALVKITPQAPVTVTVTAGANMSKTEGSGEASQTLNAGSAMTAAVYTANDGYYFPADYAVDAVNGVSVTRNSFTQITVSGTPTANAAITLTAPTEKTQENTPTATFEATGADTGTLTKVTTGMKYSVDGGTNWIAIAEAPMNIGGVTAASGVMLYLPATDANTKLDSSVQTITVTQAAAPNLTAAQPDVIGGTGSIPTTSAYQKSTDGTTWENCTGAWTGLAAKETYYVRVKAAGAVLASDAQAITINPFVPEQEDTPTAAFEATGLNTGTLSRLLSGMKYRIGAGEWQTAYGTSVDLTGLITCTITVYMPGNGTTTVDSAQQSIEVDKADTPDLNVTQPAVIGGTGSVATDATHEFIKSGETVWTGCTGVTTGLTPGKYFFRVKAAGTTLASEPHTVRIEEFEPGAEPTPEAVFTATGPDCGKLTGLAADAAYSLSGLTLEARDFTADANGEYVLASGLTADTLSLVKKGNGTTTVDGGAQTIPVTKAEAPALEAVQPNYLGGKGSIPTTAAHEFSEDGADWTPCTGETAELAAGKRYYVRTAAAGAALASEPQELEIRRYVEPYEPLVTEIWSGETVTARQVEKLIEAGKTLTVKNNAGTRLILDAKALKTLEESGKEISFALETAADGTIAISAEANGKRLDGVQARLVLPAPAGGRALVRVNADGSETPVGKSLVEDGAARAVVKTGETVRVSDAAAAYPDVDEHAWYAGAVAFVTSHGLFDGTNRGFEPDATMTRAMLAAVLYRLEDAAASGENPFADVPDGAWYTDAAIWANETGIVEGTEKGFEPEEPVSREQIALMLWRYAKLLGLDVGARAPLSGFTDGEKTSDWAREAMEWAVAAGLFEGNDRNELNPRGSASRAQVAAVLERFVRLIVNG